MISPSGSCRRARSRFITLSLWALAPILVNPRWWRRTTHAREPADRLHPGEGGALAQQPGRRPAIPQGARSRATPSTKEHCPALPKLHWTPTCAVGCTCPALPCGALPRPPAARPPPPAPPRPEQARERQKAIAKEACATGCCARECGARPHMPPHAHAPLSALLCSPAHDECVASRPAASRPRPDAHTPTPTPWLTTPTGSPSHPLPPRRSGAARVEGRERRVGPLRLLQPAVHVRWHDAR